MAFPSRGLSEAPSSREGPRVRWLRTGPAAEGASQTHAALPCAPATRFHYVSLPRVRTRPSCWFWIRLWRFHNRASLPTRTHFRR